MAGAVSTGALIAGFVAYDAPARTRALWQLTAAPILGLSGALGVLSSDSAVVAVIVMTVFAMAAGFCVAVSRRLAIAARMAVLALLIAQGLRLGADEASSALLLGAAGGLLQALLSLGASVSDKGTEELDLARGVRHARDAFARNLTRKSHAFRHAVRWGCALGLAVLVYRVVDLQGHGYWVPLTVLVVLQPERDDTREKLVMRAVGTVTGLGLATGLAELLGNHVAATAIVLTVATAVSYALVAVEYALFTVAITVFVVLLADALGEDAVDSAGQRLLATAIGIALAALAFIALPNTPGEQGPGKPGPYP